MAASRSDGPRHGVVRSAGAYRLIVRSIGTADAAIVHSLRPLRVGSDAELAALIYRAPSELLADVDHDTGSKLVDVLRAAGLEVELVDADEAFEAGVGDLEVALAVQRFDNMLGIVEVVMLVLGVDHAAAMKMVSASPAVLLGAVSQATADALARRFAPLGAEIDASRHASAVFDLAAEADDDTTTRVLAKLLPDANRSRFGADGGVFHASGLDAAAAQSLWSELSRTAAKVRVINRDFQRFDVRLEAAPATPATIGLLTATTSMSEERAQRALMRVPFVLAENVRGPRMVELLEAVRTSGGRASASLLALASFGLALKPGGDRTAARPWVEAIAGTTAASEFSVPDCHALSGPLTKTQARWLQHELRKHGIASHLVER
ncbi:hypothetical protein OM076_36025 [Solirubrobacter ginsenosidimutans]|uniref:Uncharacterized protein n=1 Tax=Solirubrobacter ginsenosidimutans TaxID=490573 RepID=A0A9X3N036_9ACTN|nr:hypothetical protein [Solirubrobacter ginsenosidimutans]MDA0165732.1 hypothetical protein [Solirubrobacter ginsenosidimutans]